MSVLSRTFLFLPGIGPVRETRLWKKGVHTWADYRALDRVRGIRARMKTRHDELLALAESSLGRDPAFFARILPSPEQWRAFGHFREGAAYIDIETTGDRENLVTVVGVRHRGKSRAFVRGIDYTPAAVSAFLHDATALVTFNGASFDLPVLANEGVRLPAVPQVDLRVVFHRAGYAGGLKRIEEALGFAREGDVHGMTGYDAVKLWRRWSLQQDRPALERLIAYNAADFENLEPLADIACRELTRKLLADVTQQARLPGLAPAPQAGP